MKEFVTGSDAQFDLLKESLADGKCHVYTCSFPASFSKPTGRIGFEKDSISYILYIDKGITCTNSRSALMKDWLNAGTIRFLDFSDLKTFLKSLTFLYPSYRRSKRSDS